MSNISIQNAFQRKSFELHIAKLFELRRAHNHTSFFDKDRYIRAYAYRYLRTWLSRQSPGEWGDVPRVHFDDMGDCTLESLADRLTPESLDAARFLEVLRILEQEDVALYAGDATRDMNEAQTEEFARECTVVDDLRWGCGDDDNVIYPKNWE